MGVLLRKRRRALTVSRECAQNDTGSERASRIETAAGKVDSGELSNEEGQTDADGGEEGSLVFLGSQHEDGEDEHGSQEHFDEQASDD